MSRGRRRRPGRVVGDQLADVGDQRDGHRVPTPSARRSRASSPDVRHGDVPSSVDHHGPAVDDHVCDVGRRRGEHHRLRGRPAARGAHASRVSTATRSARAPDREPPAVGPAEAACPPRSRPEQLAGGDDAARARTRSRSSSSTARASSNRSITAWLSVPRLNSPRRRQAAPGRADAVAEVALGGRAEAGAGRRRGPCRRCPRSVRWVACTAVVRGPSTPSSRSSAVGVRPCTARHCVVLGRSARTSARAAGVVCVGPFDDRGHLLDAARPRTECIAAPTSTRCSDSCCRAPRPVRPTAPRAVAEPQLRIRPSGAPSSAAQIAGVQQRQADARRPRPPRSAPCPSRSGRRSGLPPAAWCR